MLKFLIKFISIIYILSYIHSAQAGDAKAGAKVFNKCKACHGIDEGGKNKLGPNLWNIINRPKASSVGFAYSNAIVEFGGAWTYEDLNNFIYQPKKYIKGTKMNFTGLKNIQDRADLILFLRLQSDSPVPLP